MPRLHFQIIALSAAMVLFAVAPVAAATYPNTTDEVGGGSVAARAAVTALRAGWSADLAARGGVTPAPLIIAGPSGATLSGVIGTAPDGTTLSVQRTQYTAAGVYVGVSANQGTASCTGGGTNLQGGAPRPSILTGNSSCSDGLGFSYSEVGGAGESTTRDAVEFTFSDPVLAFGAWFGDLETRTVGGGVPAILRLYDASGTLLSDTQIAPTTDQSTCSNTVSNCGNQTTRWVGFVADADTPVSRMVVLVGDEDAAGNSLAEGLSFIGPSMITEDASIELLKTAAALPVGPTVVGSTIDYTLKVTNSGDLPMTAVSVTDDFAENLDCPATTLAAGASMDCTAEHEITQPDLDAGSYSNAATAHGTAWGTALSSTEQGVNVTFVQNPRLAVDKQADTSSYSLDGAVIEYTITVENTGNVTLNSVGVTDPLIAGLDCSALPTTLAPTETGFCLGSYTVVTAGPDIRNTATATAAGGVTADSQEVDVDYVPPIVGVTLLKTAAPLSVQFPQVGDVIQYTFLVTRTGDVPLDAVSIVDDGADEVACPATVVATTMTCTGFHVITGADLSAGSYTNTATVTAIAQRVEIQSETSTVTTALNVPEITFPTLALTGSDIAWLWYVIGALVVGGLALVVIARRRSPRV